MLCNDPGIALCQTRQKIKGIKLDIGNSPDARQVTDNLNVQLLENLRVTNTRTLEDLRSAESSRAQDNSFPSLDNRLSKLALMRAVPRMNVGNTNSLVSFKDHPGNPGVCAEVKVRLYIHNAMHIS